MVKKNGQKMTKHCGVKKGKNHELEVQSKLLFNKLDTNYKVCLNLEEKVEKRIKCLDTIFSTYRMTLNPFITDESKEYQNKVSEMIAGRQMKVEELIENNSTVDAIMFEVSPILEDLKKMVSTCKVNMDRINTLWGIK